MFETITSLINSDERTEFQAFLHYLRSSDQPYLLRNDIQRAYVDFCLQRKASTQYHQNSWFEQLIFQIQEIILDKESWCIVVRPQVAQQKAFRVMSDLSCTPLSTAELLDIRDRLVNCYRPEEGDLLEVDFRPFYDYSPLIRDSKNIGQGVQYLNRYLSSRLFQSEQTGEQWLQKAFDFLSLHKYDGIQLLINERINSQQKLSQQVKNAISFLGHRQHSEPYQNIRFELQDMGLEPGWGNTAGRIRESLELLDRLIDSPDHLSLEAFLSRIPMLFRIVLVSPHGWFGQEGVLGRPDTGGQVVYILDQARSLEKQLKEDTILAGLEGLHIAPKIVILTRLIPHSDGTRCNERLEKVNGTDNVWIVRVPFRDFNLKLTQAWISRFEIWPYLETFALDAATELLAQLQGRPDLIVGNYSDGNLVAFLLARKLKVTQCAIAHALEKSKYLFSNLYWQDLEERYHFSLQFIADLIGMNTANFIVSSTYQEIAGTPESIGQYESYLSFTMPGLMHVVSGIELFSPKFNVVPPGVDEHYYFPYTEITKRVDNARERLEDLLFFAQDPDTIYGQITDRSKRPILSMARLDRVKNLSGLVECFGRSAELQDRCNLIIVAGKLKIDDSTDHEETEEINKLHKLIDQYNLHGRIRWLGCMLPKADSGELYRVIADHQGLFVQPALFEAFGLTILEAMVSGLPVFATEFGGPKEIIQDGVNGFLINPTDFESMAQKIIEFLDKCTFYQGDGYLDFWTNISNQAMKRVFDNYTWHIHTNRLLSLARIYGFWNHTSKENREELLRYSEVLFHLLFKPRANALLQSHLQR